MEIKTMTFVDFIWFHKISLIVTIMIIGYFVKKFYETIDTKAKTPTEEEDIKMLAIIFLCIVAFAMATILNTSLYYIRADKTLKITLDCIVDKYTEKFVYCKNTKLEFPYKVSNRNYSKCNVVVHSFEKKQPAKCILDSNKFVIDLSSNPIEGNVRMYVDLKSAIGLEESHYYYMHITKKKLTEL